MENWIAKNVVEIKRLKLKMQIHISYSMYQKKKDYEDWDLTRCFGTSYKTQLVKTFYEKYEL